MSFDNPNRPGHKKGLGPLAITVLVLVALVAGVVTWLQLTAPAPDPASGPAAVTMPLAKAPAPAAPSAAPPTEAPDTDTKAPDPAQPTPAQPTPTQPTLDKPTEQPAVATAPTKTPAPEPTPVPTPAPVAQPAPIPATPKPAKPSQPPPADGLARAPDPALVEASRFGRLPRVAPDGRKAWQAYARPFDANDQRPRISIIVGSLGLSGAATEGAIQRLPGPVTLSFSPYARGLDNWIVLARAAGHEVLLDLPMEPINFPANDPGPETLLTSLTAEQNRARLHSLLGRVSGYVGVVNHMGSRFTTSAPHLRPILTELRDRGLLFIDSRSSLRSVAARTASELKLPRAINNRFIDAEASRVAIDARLTELERIARISGFAVGISQAFPVTLDRLARWTRTLKDKGFALAPASAMVNAQPD